MKKTIFILFFFLFIVGSNLFFAQVRINFIRYKQIEYNSYLSKWDSWPTNWSESGAYAIVENIYDETYNVSIFGYDDSFLASSMCTFDSKTSTTKRDSQDLPYLNCYTDDEGDQVWTNVVSLESLVQDANGWAEDEAQLYLWIFSGETPFAFVFE